MPIPPALKASVDQELAAYCEKKIPERVKDQLRLVRAWDGNMVALIEQRPRWNDPSTWLDRPIAQFRYHPTSDDWTIYWRDQHQRWHIYKEHSGSRAFFRLLAEVDQDPTHIFWG